jgi:hypothetical protein
MYEAGSGLREILRALDLRVEGAIKEAMMGRSRIGMVHVGSRLVSLPRLHCLTSLNSPAREDLSDPRQSHVVFIE